MDWDTSCQDWERRIVARESLIPKPLFPDRAQQAWDIFGGLILTDVPGRPRIRDVCLPWTRDLVMAIFGAYEEDAGRQLINTFFLCVSKKNAKSTIAAGVMLTALILNWRDSAELLVLSPTKEVADNSYAPMREMIKADPELDALFKVQDHIRTITHLTTNANLKVVAADSATVAGKKASFVFVDELHEFGAIEKSGSMLVEATGGLASRPEGFVIYATTQSKKPPAGVFAKELRYARGVRDGRIKDRRYLPIIYEFPRHMIDSGAYMDMANAYVTNPNWGASVDAERITQLESKAREDGGDALQQFWSKHLNVEIGLNLSSDRWAGADYWESCKDATPVTLDRILAECEVIDVGIDGGGLDDLLGLAVVGRKKDSQQWMIWAHAWAHPSVMERNKQSASRLMDFAKDGDLTIVDRIGQDSEAVADICGRIYASNLLDKIGVDPHGLGSILEELENQEIPADKIIGISQGWKLTSAIKTLERALATKGRVIHSGAALMNWSVGNAKVEPRGNAVTITKQGSGAAKIDPLMATFNAVSLMALNPESATAGYQMFVVG
jgi:phage terminase large subunit-like protein